MKIEQKLLGIQDGIEVLDKQYSIGQRFLLPMTEIGLIIVFIVGLMWLAIYQYNGYNILENGYVLPIALGAFIVCGLGRVFGRYRLAYLQGYYYHAFLVQTGAIKAKQEKVISESTKAKSKVKAPAKSATSSQNLMAQDAFDMLQQYYQSGTVINRENGMKTLSHRKNSKLSANNAIEYLSRVGVTKKGQKRNDPWVVVPQTYPEAQKVILEYNKGQKK